MKKRKMDSERHIVSNTKVTKFTLTSKEEDEFSIILPKGFFEAVMDDDRMQSITKIDFRVDKILGVLKAVGLDLEKSNKC
jgi:hypothetical protein